MSYEDNILGRNVLRFQHLMKCLDNSRRDAFWSIVGRGNFGTADQLKGLVINCNSVSESSADINSDSNRHTNFSILFFRALWILVFTVDSAVTLP